MKRSDRYIRIAVLAFLLTSLAACSKNFLEITPKGKLITTTVADYDLLLNNLDLVNMGTDAQLIMGDEIAAVEPYFSGAILRAQRLFRWENVIYADDEDANETKVPMSNIYLYNKIINEVIDATGGTDQQKASLQAEALAGRAWTNFLLINYYGKPYNAATAATDPGYPIVTDADVTDNDFKRASVQEVYDFIIADLQKAIPDLPARITHRLRMSKAAGQALLGKVYMFMGKYEEALPLLNDAFISVTAADLPVRLYDYNVTFGTGGAFLPIGINGPVYPTAPGVEENIYVKQFTNSYALRTNALVIPPQTIALFSASDLRRFWYTNTPYSASTPFPAGLMRRRGPSQAYFGITLPDLYLLRAETSARLNDLPGAVADLEALRTRRMPAADAAVPSSIAGDRLSLISFVLEERIREFAVQGYRWFDMRRLSVDPLFTMPTYTHQVFSEMGVTTTYTLKPERLTLQLPPKAMAQNPGMKNNP